MSEELIHELLITLRENNELIRQLVLKSELTLVGVKKASQILNIHEAGIRELCEKGILKGVLKNTCSKNKHWLIDISQAKNDLHINGHLRLELQKYSSPAKRGRKSSVNLNS